MNADLDGKSEEKSITTKRTKGTEKNKPVVLWTQMNADTAR